MLDIIFFLYIYSKIFFKPRESRFFRLVIFNKEWTNNLG